MNTALKSVFALALALSVAGCGVKGALEPPPDSGIKPNASTPATVPTRNALGNPQIGGQQATSAAVAGVARGTTSEAVVNAPAGQRSSILDWLID